jgi:hypothetical protein
LKNTSTGLPGDIFYGLKSFGVIQKRLFGTLYKTVTLPGEKLVPDE